MRGILQVHAAVVIGLMLAPYPCAAQGAAFGLGARLSMVKSDADSDADAVRFTGGQIRARLSPTSAIELSLDVHSETSPDLTERVRDLPVQASLLLMPIKGSFSPYVLGGAGWYFQRVEALVNDDVVDSVTSRDFGWHGGFGAELRLGRHAGLHGDYRYTFLHFGDDDDEDSSRSRFLPRNDGSMWTAGFTIYF